jgi:hypothetical protein
MLTGALVLGFLMVAGWLLLRAFRRHAAAKAEAQAREAAFVQALTAGVGGSGTGKPPSAGQPRAPVAPGNTRQALKPAPQPPAAPPPAPADGPVAYLDADGRAVFSALRAALPKHEVFPCASLQRVVGTQALGKDLPLDFVVCDAALAVLAAVDLERADDLPPVVGLKTERLRAAGVRYVRLPAQAMPAAERLRSVVLG